MGDWGSPQSAFGYPNAMLAKYVLNEEKPHGLKDMVRRYLPEYGDYEKQDKFDKIHADLDGRRFCIVFVNAGIQ